MGTEEGLEVAGSPPANPPSQDASGGSPPPSANDPPPSSSTGSDEGTPGGSPPPADQNKDANPSSPATDDQLEDALNLLATPETRTAEPKAGQPSPQGDEKPDQGKVDAEAKGAKPTDDAYAGMDPEEVKTIQARVKTRKRFEDLHGRARAAEERAKALELVKGPALEVTELMRQAKVERELTFVAPTQLVALTVAQAAMNRISIAKQQGRQPEARDLDVAKKFLTGMDQAAKAVGVATETEYTGEIPKDIKDLYEVYNVIDEKEAKAIAAMRAAKNKAPPAPKQDPSPVSDQAPASHQAPQAQPQEAEDQVWIEATLTRLNEDGIDPNTAQDYFESKLLPRMHAVLADKVPGLPPDQVMERLTPKAKHQLTVMAHQAERAASNPPRTNPNKQTAPRGRPLTGSGNIPRAPVSQPGATAVDDAVAYLARK